MAKPRDSLSFVSQQALPESPESERAILGAILIDPTVLKELAELAVHDFFHERHQILFQAMLDLAAAGIGIDSLTLQALLEQRGLFESVGGLAYISGLDLDLPDINRIKTYAAIVVERSVRRKLIRAGGDLIRNSLDGGFEAPKLVADLRDTLDSLLAASVPTNIRHISETVSKAYDLIDDPEAHRELLQGMSTGFPELDRLGPPLLRGSLGVIAGRPGMGKTTFALAILRELCLRRGRTGVFFSLEMSDLELTLSILCAEAEVPISRLRIGRLASKDYTRLVQAGKTVFQSKLYVDATPGLTLRNLVGRLHRFKAEHGELDVAALDYLQLASTGERFQNRSLEVSAISRGLKVLAGELDIPFLALSQLNRLSTQRSNPRPNLADLRESGAIENDADWVAFVHRPELFDRGNPELRGVAELIVDKFRQGRTGTVPLFFIEEFPTFKPVTPAAGPDPF